MRHPKLRHALAIGALAILGATGTFVAGAKAGAALNHHLGSTSVARIPIAELQQGSVAPSLPSATLARK